MDVDHLPWRFGALRGRLRRLREDARSGGHDYRILMPNSAPQEWLSNRGNRLGQYGRLLAGEPSAAAKDAFRIPQYVLAHAIEPARGDGGDTVDGRVRDVNQALGLKEA